MRTILTAAAFLTAMFLAMGCQASPGVTQMEYSKTVDKNGTPVVTVKFLGSKDTSIIAGPQNQPGFSANMNTGVITIQNMTANGSNLAGINAPLLAHQSDNATSIALAFVALVQSGAIQIPGLGGGSIISGATTTTDTTGQAQLRADMLARIAACPSMSASEKTAWSTVVNKASGAQLVEVLPTVNAALLVPIPAPAAVKASK